MGHEKEGEGIEFEFSSSSRSLKSIFLGRGGGGSSSFRVRVRVAGNCTVPQQVRQACMTQGGETGREQFENSSRTQLVISSRTVEE